MKEIIAILRPNKMNDTKKALDRIGFPSITAVSALGRGKQRGIAREVGVSVAPDVLGQSEFRKIAYVPKRIVFLIVPSNQVKKVVQTIVKINRTGMVGDGKIIISPVEFALRLRTGEVGDAAVV